jgi:hypothetical protein
MNKFLKAGILLVAIGLVIWLWLPTKHQTPALKSTSESIHIDNFATNESQNVVPSKTTQTDATTGNAVQQKVSDVFKTNEIVQSIEAKNSPISFFGKIVDQDENPVSGAKVSSTIRQWYVKSPVTLAYGAHFIPVETESDSNGRFEISGKSGDGFGVGIVKDGYQLSPKAPRGFGPTAGSFENPIIFKMWKMGDSATLISQDKDTRIPYDGTPVVFDLLTGQKNTGDSATGDLLVTLTRNPLNIPSGYRNEFEWHATIEAIEGGLIQSDDEFMYSAPETGYQPRIQIDMPASATNWANIYNISFFAKTRGGSVYSRVKFVFRVDSPKPQTGFTITSSANPSGSRNLQP